MSDSGSESGPLASFLQLMVDCKSCSHFRSLKSIVQQAPQAVWDSGHTLSPGFRRRDCPWTLCRQLHVRMVRFRRTKRVAGLMAGKFADVACDFVHDAGREGARVRLAEQPITTSHRSRVWDINSPVISRYFHELSQEW